MASFSGMLRILPKVGTQACNDGEVQAVMEIDDEGESLGWCLAVTSLCAAVGST